MYDKTKIYQRVIAKCWIDEEFKKQFIADPVKVFEAEGLEVEKGITLNVVENNEECVTVVIPVKPSNLSDEDLANNRDVFHSGTMGTHSVWC